MALLAASAFSEEASLGTLAMTLVGASALALEAAVLAMLLS